MQPRTLVLSSVVVLALAAGGGWWRLSQANTAAAETSTISATGTIEARTVNLAPELGGQVVQVLVEAGDRVRAGQVLVQLDPGLLQVQRQQAQAALAAAQANHDSLQSGATQAQLQAALSAAQMQVLSAQQALHDLQDNAAVTSAQADQAVAAAQSALTAARKQVTYAQNPVGHTLTDAVRDARVALDAAQANAQLATVSQPVQEYTNQYWQTDYYWKRYQDLQAKYDAAPNPDSRQRAQNAYNDWKVLADQQAQRQLTAQTDQSVKNNAVLQAQRAYSDAVTNLNSALAGPDVDRLAVATANEAAAEATLAYVKSQAARVGAGPDPEQLALAQARLKAAQTGLAAAQAALAPVQLDAAQAQVDAARAQLDALDLQLKKLTITAPWDGVVLYRSVEVGQTALPGGTLLELGRLNSLELTAYLPEEQFGSVKLGDPVRVAVDAYAGRTFSGTVLRMADQAEFTPTNAQTKDDRTRLVYAVVIGLDNPDLALKPGMIADVAFGQ